MSGWLFLIEPHTFPAFNLSAVLSSLQLRSHVLHRPPGSPTTPSHTHLPQKKSLEPCNLRWWPGALGMWKKATDRCPLTRGVTIKKIARNLIVWPAFCSPITLNLMYVVNAISLNKPSGQWDFYLLYKAKLWPFFQTQFEVHAAEIICKMKEGRTLQSTWTANPTLRLLVNIPPTN